MNKRSMTANQLIECLIGYLTYSMDNKTPEMDQIQTIVHDLCGWQRKEDCFSPRSSGYKNYCRVKYVK
jgi:hypothetical protein